MQQSGRSSWAVDEAPVPCASRLITRQDLDLLLNAFPGASDVFIKADVMPVARVEGVHKVIMNRRLSDTEVRELLTHAYQKNVSGHDRVLASPEPLDFAYEDRNRQRFRVSFVRDASYSKGRVSATFRRINAEPWSLEAADPPADLVEICDACRNGLVLVTGPTGSGKSSLLSALLRHLLEQPGSSHRLATVEQPVEFIYQTVAAPTAVVDQLAVGGAGSSVTSFAQGVRAHLRMAPTIILVGEVRDAETADACLWAAQSGHLVFATMHPGTVAETFSYWRRFFPPKLQSAMIYSLVASLRYVIAQHLVRGMDGHRLPVREWLNFHVLGRPEAIAERLADAGDRLFEHMMELTEKHGHPFRRSAEELLARGRVERLAVGGYLGR